MLASRVKLLLGAAAAMAGFAICAMGPAPAQASVGEVGDVGAVVWAPCDGTIASCLDEPICIENSTICVEPVEPEPIDPNNVCVIRDVCVSGLGGNIDIIVQEATEAGGVAVGIVLGGAGIVLGVAGGAVDTVNETLDEGVCVAPLDPEQPICVHG